MSRSKDEVIAKIAVKKGLMTLDQLKLCLSELEALDQNVKSDYSLLDIIINNGFATKIQLENLDQTAGNNLLAELSSSPLEHQIIDGYEIKEKIGSGAMGVVYRALQTAIGRDVALKILPPKLAKDDEYKERFLREARAAAKLNHQNIVCAYDVGMSNGLYYFAMELIEGESVMKLIHENGYIDEKQSVHIVKQVALALKVAWKQNIVHRDVKPENIIINKDGVAKLCDLGLAKQIDADPDLTASGAAVGTPFYISPEQAKGKHEIDIRSDIYSLGATLFHMVIGRQPFEGTSAAVIMTKHINQPLPEPCVLRRSLSQKLGLIIKRMMAKLPEDRYQTPVELLEDLDRYEKNKPLSAQIANRQLSAGFSPISSKPEMPKGHRLKSDVQPRTQRLAPKIHAAPKRKSNATLYIVTAIILIAAATLVIVFAGNNDSDTGNNNPPEVLKVDPKKDEGSTIRKEEKTEDSNKPNDKSESEDDKKQKKLEELQNQVKTLIAEAESEFNKGKIQNALSILENIIKNPNYIAKVPELVKISKDKITSFEAEAEKLAKLEIESITRKITENNFATDSVAPYFNKILELWAGFNEELKFTEEYKNTVIGTDGIIEILRIQADEYLEKIKKAVSDLIPQTKFDEALNVISEGQARLPERYENSLYELINDVNDAKLAVAEKLEKIKLEKKQNAPELYKNWLVTLKSLVNTMKINEAVSVCSENLASEDYNLNETVVNQLNSDLKLLEMIQSIYSDVYNLIQENGQSGKTLEIDFDEFKQVSLYVNFTNLEEQETELDVLTRKDFQFTYIQSDDPQKKGSTDKYLFSTTPDKLFEMLYRYTLGLSSATDDEKLSKLVTFYVLNLPSFPKPEENDIENAVLKVNKIFSNAKSLKINLSLHSLILDRFKTRFDLVALTQFAEIEKKFKLWERKSKGKYKNELAEELITEITDFLKFFEGAKVLTDNDFANTKKMNEWLDALKKQLIEDREVELFYGDYKLKGNNLEILYDFTDKNQILDFEPSDTNHSGIYGWDKNKKAMIISANPSFRREDREIAGLKWLGMFGDKEFNIKFELEIPHGLFFSLNLFKNDGNQYSIPLRARMRFWQRVMQIKHGLYSGTLDIMEPDKNKALSELSDEMAPESGTLIYQVRRDRKGYIYSYINNNLVFKVKEDSLTKGFMEFNAVFARLYVKKIEIECELDKEWLKNWEKSLKEQKDPRKDTSASTWDSDEDYKKKFDWGRRND